MALFQALYSADPTVFNIHAVSAGNQDELVTALNAEVAAAVLAGERSIIDFNVSGTGAGPNWEAWFVTVSASESTPLIPLQESVFVADVAANPIEAVLRVNQALAVANPGEVFKMEVAGGGIGTIFMAVALVLVELQA